MSLVLLVFCKLCCRSIACVVAFICLFLYVPRENCVENVSSNDADWIRDLRFIIAAQKNYVLDAPLGDRPITGADADVMNV